MASSTNISATRSWPIGALRLTRMANRPSWPALPRSTWPIAVRRCALNCRNCWACARCRDEARQAFGAGLEAIPVDGPSMALIGRIDDFLANPPAADWDGAWHLDHK